MTRSPISAGVVHDLPADLRARLVADPAVLAPWEDITPLARNEWICWIESVKKAETRLKHLDRACEDLKAGKRRPCCWPGCPHREKGAGKRTGGAVLISLLSSPTSRSGDPG